ncbi:hypothetical protein [Mycolicibacter minnesotensis]
MKAGKLMAITALAVVVVVTAIAGYVFWQYRTSEPPALGEIRVYAQSADVPVTAVPGHDGVQQRLRQFADGLRPGYRIADERFLAAGVPLVWDAVRHFVGPCLRPAGYVLTADGFSPDSTIEYSLYGRGGGLRRWFNDDLILVAGQGQGRAPVSEAAAPQAELYAYFRLTRN